MKQFVELFDYAGQICQALKKGILLTTAAEGKVNTMTIGWGHMGIDWSRPIFVAYVRETRHTRTMLDENGEFTVNIPLADYDAKVLGYCGTKSGRDCDKIRNLGLTLEDPVSISVPGIREFPLTLECKVLYKQKQDLSSIPADILSRYYPEDETGFRDYHYAYYGQILSAYIITG